MEIDSEHWDQLQMLFHLAASTPEADRGRILETACPDKEIRQRVMDILAAAEIGNTAVSVSSTSEAGSGMGPYRLLHVLGSGGIGTVYLAERLRGAAIQKCALKVLSPHAAGAEFVERFQREQGILSSFDHPNITRMLDAGHSETGQPYLVMEYVDGRHLDVSCDEKKLSIEGRLRLFLSVCDAVAYAHQNLVVHLDLKPSNVLVTADGTVKLLDFGTSKLIQLDGRLTSTLMATPAYASPEQLRSEPVTTLCDVYSLGAMLFELLAGRRVGDKESVAAMLERAWREQEPERLESAVAEQAAELRGLNAMRLRQRLSGDLATIVAKCLRPRPRDRYISVNALINDVQRHLDGRPVLARPQTVAYRLGKFVRRNRPQVVTAAVLLLLFAGTLAYAGWRQEQALREGQRAVRMQTFLYRLFKLANSNYTGKPDATLPEFLQLGVKVLPQYIPEPRDLREAQLGLAESMYDNGDLDHANTAFKDVMASARRDGDKAAEAEAETFSGDIAFQQGRMEEGKRLTEHSLDLSQAKGVPASVRVWSEIYFAVNRENYGFRDDRNVRLLEDAVKQSRENRLTPQETAFALTSLADDLGVRGLLEQAEPKYMEALAIYGKDPLALCEQSGIYGDLGYIRERSGDSPASLQMYQKAYDGYVKCSGPDSRNALSERDFVAGELIKTGRAPEAVAMLEPILPLWRKMVGENPDLAEVLYFLSQGYVETGQYEKAVELSKEGIDVQTGKVLPIDRRFGVAHWIWARALVGEKKYAEALPHARLADALLNHNAVSSGARKVGAEAHALRVEVEGKAGAAESSKTTP
ncbi:MAG TPA: protein kinase [Acidobacteriaceae bacterium]|jgi:serine/threonine-protein kinase